MKRFALPVVLTLTVILAACSTATPLPEPTPAPLPTATTAAPSGEAGGTSDLTRSDQQGQVTVDITPLNLDAPGDTLEFDVALNTHSVDLSMDLAPMSTLSTDTGLTVNATLWDAPLGGHHVAGKLIFPATVEGKSILEGPNTLTLTIAGLDVPSRVFEWQLK